eukprot:GHVU01235462.1.p1 GENE.GHVU01235462.1~~GHVU01235462.1.p1  ORF type:complete len:123 (+),score=20.41 GHVU01235462.1:117-485(+)
MLPSRATSASPPPANSVGVLKSPGLGPRKSPRMSPSGGCGLAQASSFLAHMDVDASTGALSRQRWAEECLQRRGSLLAGRVQQLLFEWLSRPHTHTFIKESVDALQGEGEPNDDDEHLSVSE